MIEISLGVILLPSCLTSTRPFTEHVSSVLRTHARQRSSWAKKKVGIE